MTAKTILCRVLAVSTCCLLITACGAKEDPQPEPEKTQTAPAPAPEPEKQGGVKIDPKTPAGKTDTKTAPGKNSKQPAALSDAELKKTLDDFAHKTVAEMNRYALPSKGKKEVVKNPDGTFTARYVEVDPGSIRTSYKKPESSTAISYVGYITYDEGVYVCKAASKEAAEAGPFTCQQRTSMTELIKHSPKAGWSY